MSEQNLIIAIIQQAILDVNIRVDNFTKFRNKNRRTQAKREKKEAIIWLLSESDKFMSSQWYCNLIQLDPQYVRRKINVQRLAMWLERNS